MTPGGRDRRRLTSPADEATLAARIERSQMTWRGELPKSEQGLCSFRGTASARGSGICAIEVVGVTTPGTTIASVPRCTHRKELNVTTPLPTLFLSNDHTGSSELYAVPGSKMA